MIRNAYLSSPTMHRIAISPRRVNATRDAPPRPGQSSWLFAISTLPVHPQLTPSFANRRNNLGRSQPLLGLQAILLAACAAELSVTALGIMQTHPATACPNLHRVRTVRQTTLPGEVDLVRGTTSMGEFGPCTCRRVQLRIRVVGAGRFRVRGRRSCVIRVR